MKARKWISVLLTLVLMLGLLAGCGGSSKGIAQYESAAEAPAAEMAMDMAASGVNGIMTEDGGSAQEAAIPENRKWIITMDISAETEDLDQMLAALNEQISALGGYIEGQNVYNGSSYSQRRYRSANLTVRIPADTADRFTEEVSGISNVVRSSKDLQDITLTYYSTESRVTALQTEEARLLELMEQAETMADLLEIEARLTDVRYELENFTTQLRTYDNQVNYATIYLNIEEVQEYTPAAERTVWQRISQDFVANLKGLGDGFVDLIVWILSYSPFLVVYGILIAAAAILVRKGLKKKKAKKLPPEQPK